MRCGLLQYLERHVLEVYPRRGMFVTSVEIRDLASLAEVRSVLESSAARLAAERATDDDRDAVAALLDELDHHTELDQRELMALDERIHRQVYRCAHNQFLEASLEQYYLLALRIWYLALDQTPELPAAVQEHDDLLEAIGAGDARRAEKLMRAHVQHFEDAMGRVLLPA